MKNSLLLIFLIIPILIFGQKNNPEIWPYFSPKDYIAYKTNTILKIDGIDSESVWKNAKWTDNFVDIEGSDKKLPKYSTKLKMLWDDTYFYFFVQIEEPHVWGDIVQRDAVIFHNNDFEIFMKPQTEATQYGEIEINALGTIWDLMLTKPYRDGGNAITTWNIKGLKAAIHVNGTLNNPSDIDTGWTIEMAVPRKELKDLTNVKAENKNPGIWRINFSRVEWDFDLLDNKYIRKKDSNGKYLPEKNWVWSPQGTIDMHKPEKWGYVKFSEKEPGTEEFLPDVYEGIVDALHYLNRLEKEFYLKNGKYSNNAEKLEIRKFVFNNEVFIPQIEITNSTYRIFFKIGKQRIIYSIDNKGTINKTKY